MARSVALTLAMVLLIGNYPADQQQSMQRFAMMMLQGLNSTGVPAELIQPQPFLGRISSAGTPAAARPCSIMIAKRCMLC